MVVYSLWSLTLLLLCSTALWVSGILASVFDGSLHVWDARWILSVLVDHVVALHSKAAGTLAHAFDSLLSLSDSLLLLIVLVDRRCSSVVVVWLSFVDDMGRSLLLVSHFGCWSFCRCCCCTYWLLDVLFSCWKFCQCFCCGIVIWSCRSLSKQLIQG